MTVGHLTLHGSGQAEVVGAVFEVTSRRCVFLLNSFEKSDRSIDNAQKKSQIEEANHGKKICAQMLTLKK